MVHVASLRSLEANISQLLSLLPDVIGMAESVRIRFGELVVHVFLFMRCRTILRLIRSTNKMISTQHAFAYFVVMDGPQVALSAHSQCNLCIGVELNRGIIKV